MTAPLVVVAGAGLAGAAFAACAAARGADVVVLERTTRTPAGGIEAFAPGVHRLLAALSLHERAHAAGFARQEVSVLDWGNGEQPWRSPHAGAGAYDHGCHAGYGEFVELLLSRAVESGARVLRGAEVLEPVVERDTVTGLRYHYRGEDRAVSADLVADATGADRAVSGPLSPAERESVTHWMARSRVDGGSEGEFVLAQAQDGAEWTWSVPLHNGTGLGTLVVGGDDRGRGDGERWRGCRSARLAGAGWLSVGDAAGAPTRCSSNRRPSPCSRHTPRRRPSACSVDPAVVSTPSAIRRVTPESSTVPGSSRPSVSTPRAAGRTPRRWCGGSPR
ncbi:tryptophan 7-halogenase [Prauserella oleivorans]